MAMTPMMFAIYDPESGWSITRLAAKIGKPRQRVADWARGLPMSEADARTVARALGIAPELLQVPILRAEFEAIAAAKRNGKAVNERDAKDEGGAGNGAKAP